MAADVLLRSRHIVTPTGVRDGVVVVRAGQIAALLPVSAGEARSALDLGEAWLIPGLVDTHVHVNEPGRTEWEGFTTASAAAAAGGVTALVDMPLNSVPAATTAAALALKSAAAAAAGPRVDYGFWGGVIPGNAGELGALAAGGALGFKCFLAPSGVEEFPLVTEADLEAAMPIIARLGLPLLVHAELPEPIEAAARAAHESDPRRHATWLASRPPEAEVEAIRLMIRLCDKHRGPVHVVHLSAAEALGDLRAARRRGVPITVETCPHYLCFEAEAVPDGATEYKCAPPIRARANRERLWQALAAGEIDLVASDHSPCPPGMKLPRDGDFLRAWGGIASLEIGLSAVWTEARARGFTPSDLARWMSERPAQFAGLARKGRIEPGADADLVAWNPSTEWTVAPERLHQRHKLTPYAGRRLAGGVERVWLRGALVREHDRAVGAPRGIRVGGNVKSCVSGEKGAKGFKGL